MDFDARQFELAMPYQIAQSLSRVQGTYVILCPSISKTAPGR